MTITNADRVRALYYTKGFVDGYVKAGGEKDETFEEATRVAAQTFIDALTGAQDGADTQQHPE